VTAAREVTGTLKFPLPRGTASSGIDEIENVTGPLHRASERPLSLECLWEREMATSTALGQRKREIGARNRRISASERLDIPGQCAQTLCLSNRGGKFPLPGGKLRDVTLQSRSRKGQTGGVGAAVSASLALTAEIGMGAGMCVASRT